MPCGSQQKGAVAKVDELNLPEQQLPFYARKQKTDPEESIFLQISSKHKCSGILLEYQFPSRKRKESPWVSFRLLDYFYTYEGSMTLGCFNEAAEQKKSGMESQTKEPKFEVFGILILIIEAYPLIYVLSASLSSSDAVSLGKVFLWPVEFSLDGYKHLAENSQILTGYKNSLIYLAVGVTINMLFTLLLAFPLSRRELPGRNLITIFVTITMYISGGLIPTYLLVDKLHMVDTLWGLILPSAISTSNMIIMRTYFTSTIPEELREASFLDGCGYIKFFLKVVLPLSAPILAVIALYYAVASWNTYFSALIYLRSSDKANLQLVLRNILLANQISSGEASYTEGAKLNVTIKYAVIVAGSIPMLIIYPFVQRHFTKGVMIGSIKG